jgi:hypothetical protein
VSDPLDPDTGPAGGLTDDESAYHELRGLLDASLRQPLAEYDWSSRRARWYWSLREGSLDALAGLLTAIAEHGDCDSMYRDDDRWPHVRGADDFRVWARQAFEALRADVQEFRPGSPGEEADFAYMLEVLSDLEAAVDLAIDLELRRAAARESSRTAGSPPVGEPP